MGISLIECVLFAKTEGEHTFTITEAGGSGRVMKLSGENRTYSHTAEPRFVEKANKTNELPEITAADAGKVLGVTEEGKIAAVEAGGGGKITGTIVFQGLNSELSLSNRGSVVLRSEGVDGLLYITEDITLNANSNVAPVAFVSQLIPIVAGGAYPTIASVERTQYNILSVSGVEPDLNGDYIISDSGFVITLNASGVT